MRCFSTAILALTLVAAAPVMGRQDQQAEAKAWFLDRLASANAKLADQSFKIEYRVESLEKVDTSNIAVLRETVRTFPEHPDRGVLQRAERFLKYGPDARTHTLWFREGEARYNREAGIEPGDTYQDACLLKSSGWKLSPQSVFLLGPAGQAPPGHRLDTVINSALYEVISLIGPGLAGFGPWNDQSVFALAADGAWKAENTTESNGKARKSTLTGSWDVATRSGRFAQGVIEIAGRVVYKETAKSWKAVSGWPGEIAERVEIEDNGKPWQGVVSLSIAPLIDKEFEAVTQTPSIDGEDSIRGASTFTQLQDLSGRVPTYIVKDPASNTIQAFSQSETASGHRQWMLRTFGWVTAGLIVIALVLIRIRGRTAG